MTRVTRDVSLRMTQELYERLSQAALAERRSRSDLIRQAVEQYLDLLEALRRSRSNEIAEGLMEEILGDMTYQYAPRRKGAA